jgi:hypothetical protein
MSSGYGIPDNGQCLDVARFLSPRLELKKA